MQSGAVFSPLHHQYYSPRAHRFSSYDVSGRNNVELQLLKAGLILIATVVLISMPWLIVDTDINSAIHSVPGGWNVWLSHSTVVIHSPRNYRWPFSLKDVFVTAGTLILIGLIIVAAVRQRQRVARGFEIYLEQAGAAKSSTGAARIS